MSRRLVSLPFSDHCDLLVDDADDLSAMLDYLISEMVQRRRWSSLELRPRCATPKGLTKSASYHLHSLDLARSSEQIFKGFHHSSTQRAIQRAEREGVSYEAGTSERFLSAFYGLLRQARRRHGLPPQPLAWFRNLIACLGDGLTIHLARKAGQPIASILTLSFKKTMVYKYGGSDARYHRLGTMPFLFWKAIQQAKGHGIEALDLGRSNIDQAGLVAFKEHLGGTRSTLTYFTCPESRTATAQNGHMLRAARWAVAHLPDGALDLTGRLLYRHVG
jgi:lipid II:glycine glycyltransferase (peptidoglycan interpeptide bridge formation enzyme)